MKNKIWLVFLVLALAVSPVLLHGCAPAAPEEKPTIVIVENDWTSSLVESEILAQVLTKQLGYPTDRVQLSASLSWPAICKGEADVNVEIWLPGRRAEIQPFIDEGCLELGAKIFPGGAGWVMPRYVIEGDPARGIEPMAPDLKSILDLKEEKHWKLFENPEEPGLGELVGGSPGWVDDPMDRSIILGYDLPLWRSNRSEAIMMARMIAADKKGEPLLMYIWWPHWVLGVVDLVALEEPDLYYEGCFRGEEVVPVRCGHPKYSVHTVVASRLKETAPDVYCLMHSMVLGEADANALMMRVDVGGEEILAIAEDWISQNQDKIDQWLAE